MNARLWGEGSAVQVACDEHGRPQSFNWQGQEHHIQQVCNRWRVHQGWWRHDEWQEYVKVTTADGLLCVLARDLHTGQWLLVRLYD